METGEIKHITKFKYGQLVKVVDPESFEYRCEGYVYNAFNTCSGFMYEITPQHPVRPGDIFLLYEKQIADATELRY